MPPFPDRISYKDSSTYHLASSGQTLAKPGSQRDVFRGGSQEDLAIYMRRRKERWQKKKEKLLPIHGLCRDTER